MSLVRFREYKTPIISAKTLKKLRASLKEVRDLKSNAYTIVEFASFSEKYGVFFDCRKKMYVLVGYSGDCPCVDLAISGKLVDLFEVVGENFE